jgi:hypothetical protein
MTNPKGSSKKIRPDQGGCGPSRAPHESRRNTDVFRGFGWRSGDVSTAALGVAGFLDGPLNPNPPGGGIHAA